MVFGGKHVHTATDMSIMDQDRWQRLATAEEETSRYSNAMVYYVSYCVSSTVYGLLLRGFYQFAIDCSPYEY